MKVLIVASYNKGYFAPFILEQAEALIRNGCNIEFFGVTGKGIKGYVKSFPALLRKVKEYSPDIIHAHYGLSGLLSNFQRRVPVVTTYHGSDINKKTVLPFSRLSMIMSRYNIFVSRATMDMARQRNRCMLLPCGVDLVESQLVSRADARTALGMDEKHKYVLFSGSFTNTVKNVSLAKAAISLLPGTELLELKGYSKSQVYMLMCGVDALLMTSNTEGSPQVVKEAMACGCPVVSVDVGDVKETFGDVPGCVLCERNPGSIADGLMKAFNFTGKTPGRDRLAVLGLTNENIVDKLMALYDSLLNGND